MKKTNPESLRVLCWREMQHCNALQESGRTLPATARGKALGQVQTPQVMQVCSGDKTFLDFYNHM